MVKKNFSCHQKLHYHYEYNQLFLNKQISGEWFTIYFKENLLGFERLGIVISKRVEPKAVLRNRMKRVIREIFRLSTCENYCSLDIVVRLKRKVINVKATEIRQSLFNLLVKVRKTKNDTSITVFN